MTVPSSTERKVSLRDLYFSSHEKVSDKWSSYLEFYDTAFGSFRDSAIKLLEVGIQNGGSLEIWPQFFPRGQIFVGCDIDPKCGQLKYADSRVNVVIGDIKNDATIDSIVKHSSNFDIIIDDGSHLARDVVTTFAKLFSRLSDGGLYVIEDLHCSYWRERFEGGLAKPHSTMSFIRRLTDVIHSDHWGIQNHTSDVLSDFSREFEVEFLDEDLAHIRQIIIQDSIVAILKDTPRKLGARVVTGTIASVDPAMPAAANTFSFTPPQDDNPYSDMSLRTTGVGG